MLLLVGVSQYHERLIFRCYDFESGDVREAPRSDPAADAALIQEFKVKGGCREGGKIGGRRHGGAVAKGPVGEAPVPPR